MMINTSDDLKGICLLILKEVIIFSRFDLNFLSFLPLLKGGYALNCIGCLEHLGVL